MGLWFDEFSLFDDVFLLWGLLMNSLFDDVFSSLGSLMMFFLWVPCLEFALEPHHLLKMILPKMFSLFFFLQVLSSSFFWVLSFFGRVLSFFLGIYCLKLSVKNSRFIFLISTVRNSRSMWHNCVQLSK